MASKPVTVNDVRAWAEGAGVPVGKRGRISKDLVAAYNQANPRRKYTGAT